MELTNKEKYKIDKEIVDKYIAKLNLSGISLEIDDPCDTYDPKEPFEILDDNDPKYSWYYWCISGINPGDNTEITINLPELKYNTLVMDQNFDMYKFMRQYHKPYLTLDLSSIQYENIADTDLCSEVHTIYNLLGYILEYPNFKVIFNMERMTKAVKDSFKHDVYDNISNLSTWVSVKLRLDILKWFNKGNTREERIQCKTFFDDLGELMDKIFFGVEEKARSLRKIPDYIIPHINDILISLIDTFQGNVLDLTAMHNQNELIFNNVELYGIEKSMEIIEDMLNGYILRLNNLDLEYDKDNLQFELVERETDEQ